MNTYFAGLYEGEGAVGITRAISGRKNASYSLWTAMHMADKEPLAALYDAWGGCLVPSMPGVGRRPTWLWRITGRGAVPFLEAIEPHLLTYRIRSKVQLGLRFQAQKPSQGRGGGRNVVEHRTEQERWWAVMRDLNLRGTESLPDAERAELIATLASVRSQAGE